IPAPPIADRDLELEAGVAAGELLSGGDADLQPYGEIAALADEPEPHPLLVQLLELALERLDEQAHQTPHLVRGPSPVLAREGEERERLDVAPRALLDAHAHGLEPRAVPGRTRQSARGRPAAVAVHGDRDVPRYGLCGGGVHQTCMTSFSFAASSASMSAMCLSVSFCTSVSARRSSSRSEEHTSELQSLRHLVCRLLLEKKNKLDKDTGL